VASAVRRDFAMVGRLGGGVEYAKYNKSLHDMWLPLSDYEFIYEDYMQEPVKIVREVLKVIGINVEDLANKIHKQVSELRTDQYRTTLLSPTHITDPARQYTFRDTLDDSEIEKINSDNQVWLSRHGYK
jgi:hypothetical protein